MVRERSPILLKRVGRSEEHTSELQSQSNLVCRLLLEKKKKHIRAHSSFTLVTISGIYLHIIAHIDSASPPHPAILPARAQPRYPPQLHHPRLPPILSH